MVWVMSPKGSCVGCLVPRLWYIWEVVDPIRCGAETSGGMLCGGD